MINRNILHNKLVDKFHNIALNTIVSECFVGGLPINPQYMDTTEVSKLKDYMCSVMEALGGFSLLENAIESVSDTTKSNLMYTIYAICHESATTVANRVVGETNCKTENNINDVVDKAQFTDAEYSAFMSNTGSLNTDEIAKIIQEKTKAALIEEKDAYDKEEQLETELKDALGETKNMANESVSSYMDLVLDKDMPRHYVSLFSKMQAYALEAINRLNDTSDYNYFKALNELTFESFLPGFRRKKGVIEALESVISLQTANESAGNTLPKETKVKMATLVSTIAYTATESLKTLNLYNPDKDTIKKYVSSPYISLESEITNGAMEVVEKSQEAVDEVTRADFSKQTVEDLTTVVTRLSRIKELLEIIVLNNEAFLSSRTEILNSLTNTLTRLNTFIESKTADDATESSSYFDKKNIEKDVAQLNKISSLFSNNPLVSEIRLNIDPTALTSVINVTAVDASHQIVGSSFIYVASKVDNTETADYIKKIFNDSILAKSPKAVSIYFADGSGKKDNLK
jgi:hypothetical protein